MKSKSVAKINAIVTFPTSVKIHFVCFTVTGSFLITIHLFGQFVRFSQGNSNCMISMIFVVLYDILHYCNLPYERSETESSRFENNVTSSHTSECRLAVRSATRRVGLEICFSQLYPNGNKLCCFGYQLL